jgi:hypothetical protein
MKLNLLPTYVGKGRQMTVFVILGLMIMAASAGITTYMISDADRQLAKAKAESTTYDADVQKAMDYADKAQPILTSLGTVVRNKDLATAMLDHSEVFPKFYDLMRPYIPDFFRVTSMQATPVDAQTVNLRVVGVLKTEEQYRDLMLALLRIDGAQTVSRSPFTSKFSVLPGVTEADQNPTAPAPGEPALPKDQLDRLNALIATGAPRPFVAAPGYGDAPGERGPMPDYQQITVTILLKDPNPALQAYNLMTPNPSATLGVVAGGAGGGRKVAPGG